MSEDMVNEHYVDPFPRIVREAVTRLDVRWNVKPRRVGQAAFPFAHYPPVRRYILSARLFAIEDLKAPRDHVVGRGEWEPTLKLGRTWLKSKFAQEKLKPWGLFVRERFYLEPVNVSSFDLLHAWAEQAERRAADDLLNGEISYDR